MAKKKAKKRADNVLVLPSGLATLADVAATGRSRYAIGAIHVAVEDHKAHIEVTDGRMLCCFSLDAPECGDVDVLIERDTWRAGMTTTGNDQMVALHFRDDEVRFEWERPAGGHEALTVSPVDGKFPKVKGVIPNYGEDESVSGYLNPELLGRLLKPIAAAIPEMGVETHLTLTIPREGAPRPLLIAGESPDSSLAVQAAIMQVKKW